MPKRTLTFTPESEAMFQELVRRTGMDEILLLRSALALMDLAVTAEERGEAVLIGGHRYQIRDASLHNVVRFPGGKIGE